MQFKVFWLLEIVFLSIVTDIFADLNSDFVSILHVWELTDGALDSVDIQVF
jgi:hypothetical protein